MKLFSKIAYHSTDQKGLKKFKNTTSTSKAYSGEGAMVHGWGLYLQSDKQLNIDRYKNMYGDSVSRNTDCQITLGRKTYYSLGWFNGWVDSNLKDVDKINFKALTLIRKYLTVQNALENLNNGNDVTFSWEYASENKQGVVKLLEKWSSIQNVEVKEVKQEIKVGGGTQYTVEIPDDWIFIPEDEIVDMSNPNIKRLMNEFGLGADITQEDLEKAKIKVIEQVRQMWSNYSNIDCEDVVNLWQQLFMSEDIDYASFKFSRKYDDRTFEFIQQSDFGYMCKTIKYKSSGKILYKTIVNELGTEKKASDYLYENGINGIEYIGELDKHCYVIFNCSGLKIIGEEQ